jgi:hypothetical protein
MREQRTQELAAPTEDDDLTWDDEREIRYSLTALGESILTDRDPRAPSFRGFGPCVGA